MLSGTINESIRYFISFATSPLIILCFLLLLALIFYNFRKRKTSRIILVLSVLWFIAITTKFLPVLLIQHLEKEYHPFIVTDNSLQSKPIHIMVLGGGHTDNLNLPPNQQLSSNALGRLAEGIRIQRQIPNSRLIVSGWGGGDTLTQAKVLANTAISLGVNSKIITRFDQPMNTREEAEQYARKFGNDNQLILVTSASHMKRAMKWFEIQGVSPIAAPTNYSYKNDPDENIWSWIIPKAGNISKTGKAIHEYLGMVITWFG